MTNDEDRSTEIELISYFHIICEKHEYIEVEVSYSDGTNINSVKHWQCKNCGLLFTGDLGSLPPQEPIQ